MRIYCTSHENTERVRRTSSVFSWRVQYILITHEKRHSILLLLYNIKVFDINLLHAFSIRSLHLTCLTRLELTWNVDIFAHLYQKWIGLISKILTRQLTGIVSECSPTPWYSCELPHCLYCSKLSGIIPPIRIQNIARHCAVKKFWRKRLKFLVIDTAPWMYSLVCSLWTLHMKYAIAV